MFTAGESSRGSSGITIFFGLLSTFGDCGLVCAPSIVEREIKPATKSTFSFMTIVIARENKRNLLLFTTKIEHLSRMFQDSQHNIYYI
ncbi:MAG: hypothetical protein RL263_1133 [Bacteroidota bacterium]